MNKYWPRWIYASLTKFFDGKKQGVPLYFEGDEGDPSLEKDYFEFRMEGPMIAQPSKNTYNIDVMVAILVVHKLDQRNIHLFHANIGVAVAAYEKCIAAYKYGSGVDDDGSVQWGTFTLCQESADPVQVNHLGQVGPDHKEMQAIVQGHYKMYLEI